MVYCSIDDVRRKSGVTSTSDYSDAFITSDIEEATTWIERITGKKYESTTVTEYYEGRALTLTANRYYMSDTNTRIGTSQTGQHFLQSQEDRFNLILDHTPVLTISSLLFLNDDGTTDTTLDVSSDTSEFHIWEKTGLIRFIEQVIPLGMDKKKIKIIYSYGEESIPNDVRELCAVIGAIAVMTSLSGGSFKDVTNYRLGPKEVSLGEPFTNLRATVRHLERRKAELLIGIGKELRMVAI